MLIFKIEQNANDAYDTYDSAIVVACDEEHARSIHPGGDSIVWDPDSERWVDEDGSDASWVSNSWVSDPHQHVLATRFGMVTGGSAKPGDVICFSFNAG